MRDDLESFVHALFYYILRYRPTLPGRFTSRKKILQGLPAIFDQVDESEQQGVYTGGEGKRAYLANMSSHLTKSVLFDVDIPQGLLFIMETARRLFTPLYAEEPIQTLSWEGPATEQRTRWREDHDAAVQRLTSSTALISAFDAGLIPGEETRAHISWPPSDGAVDQYPLSSRPSAPFEGSHAHSAPPNVGQGIGGTKRTREAYSPGSGKVSRSSDKRPRH